MSIEEWQSKFLSIRLFKMLVGKQATQKLLDVNSKQVEHQGCIFNIHSCGALASVSDLASPSVEAEEREKD